jgi:anti-anti-sigma regulatory factor
MTESWSEVARVPLQVLHGSIVASVQVELGEETLHRFQQDLLELLRATRARAVILDLSGVGILDSSDFESVLRTLRMAAILSAMPVIVGLRPGIAASLVELGMTAGEIATCMTLEQAFALVQRHTSEKLRGKGS